MSVSKLSSTSLPWYQSIRQSRAAHEPLCIHTALAQRARSEPERVLLIDKHRCLSQGELIEAVMARGRQLLASCSREDAVVAVRLEPGIDAVISYFACLAAGFRYLPLPDYPPRVMERMLNSLSPDLFLSDDEIDRLGTRRPGSGSLPDPDPGRIAHVLPTSGTETGVPKAVLTDHVGSMLSHEWRTRIWGYRPDDVVGCNIFGIWDVVPALCHGIPVVMIDDETIRDPVSLASMIIQYGITRLMLTPTLLDACLACEDGIEALRYLRRVVLCGEVVSRRVLESAWALLPRTRISNLYSITECHDVAAIDLLPGSPVRAGYIADFAEVHVTDPDNSHRLLQAGEAGRVLIGGAALARGYVDPELTKEKFIDVSFDGGERRRVYDTGDLGVLHEDGTLDILGRIDDTVKVRGAWAEPDAIAEVLLEHPDVRRATVMVDEGDRGRARLSAFVVTGETETHRAIASLHRWLSDRVALQSVPSSIRIIDDLPLMPSGKVDHRRLANMLRAGKTESSTDGETLESTILEAFREVLDRPDASADDGVELLGGDSLLAIVLCGEVHHRTGKRVRVGDLTKYSTAHSLARLLERHPAPDAIDDWQLPTLDPDIKVMNQRPESRVPRRVLLTGATGALGSTFLVRLLAETDAEVSVLVRVRDPDQTHREPGYLSTPRLNTLVGDLAAPNLGLTPTRFSDLSSNTDVIFHLGADLNMFASWRALEATNVGGTHQLLRLAAAAGAQFHYLSSSAVLPLASEALWDEDSYGTDVLSRLKPELALSDGYSRSKFAAEVLVWQALELGLRASVTRIPHLIGPGIESRLVNTIGLLAETGLMPEGQWGWQVAPVDAVCDHLLSLMTPARPRPLTHLTSRQIDNIHLLDAFERHGIHPQHLPMPALVSSLLHHYTDDVEVAKLRASLNQLIAEYGPWAALSLADAKLASRRLLNDDPAQLLDRLILKHET